MALPHPPNRRLAPALGAALAAVLVLVATNVWPSFGQALPPPHLTRTAASGQPSPTRSVTAAPAPSGTPTPDALAALVAGTATANAGSTATPLPTPTPSPPPVPPTFTRTPTSAPFPTVPPATATMAPLPPNAFRETFDGAPAAPQPWNPPDWDVTVHSRDAWTWTQLDPTHAEHGPDCAAPPAAHTITAYEDATFLCNGHVMTAISAGGYGEVELTPPVLVDFSSGEAVIRWDMSTLRHSDRDWIDLVVSPLEDHTQLVGYQFIPDLSGEPRRAVHLQMTAANHGFGFDAGVLRDFVGTALPTDNWTPIESILTPSATRRDTFELRISRTHLKFGMPAGQPAVNNGQGFWWIDADIPGGSLDWSRGVVQFGHHSYNPQKACGFDGTCGNSTWHLDNFAVAPAVPFPMLRGDRRATGLISAQPYNPGPIVFPQPAPAGSTLRFVAMGANVRFSTDGGATWTPATLRPGSLSAEKDGGTFQSYVSPIPKGTTVVLVAADTGWWGNHWLARDFSIWGPPADTLVQATATATAPLPTAPRTATTVPTSTATRTPTPVASATGTPLLSSATPTPEPSATAAPTATEMPQPTATAVVGPDPTVAALVATQAAQGTQLAQLQRNQEAAGAALLRGG